MPALALTAIVIAHYLRNSENIFLWQTDIPITPSHANYESLLTWTLIQSICDITAQFVTHYSSSNMQRALTSRARASVLSSTASKFRPATGFNAQQLRFAHKV
jgi:hypothetical protein